MAVHETVYNVHLAELLRQQGLDAEAEVKAEAERIDVLVKAGGVRVAIEAKIRNRREALADAEERLDQDLADAAVAVSYPVLERPREMTRLDAAQAYGVWQKMDAPELARLVKTVAAEAGDEGAVIKKFRQGLESAAGRLTDRQSAAAIAAANIPLPSKGDIRKKAASAKHPRLRLALLIASAALFHANLDRVNLRKPHRDARSGHRYMGTWPPQKLKDCLSETDIASALTDAWETILALDYKPVFESAVAVLRALPPGPDVTGFAKTAARAGLWAANTLGGQRHDLLGRVFHWILSTATPTGAFYTSEAAATLLAGLVIRPEDAERFPDLTIVDPACGTGTLLVAAARQLEYLNPDEAGGDTGGKALIEDVLRGYDIEAAAVQLAAVALGLMNPRVKFRQMGIHHLKYGTDPAGTGVAGSLELFGKSAMANLLTPTSAQIDTGAAEVVEAERHDLVIMNPPFTRDSLRHDHLGAKMEKEVKKREAEIFKNEPASLRNSAGLFLILADRLCEETAGSVATVLPTVSLASPAGRSVWKWLVENFHVETIVTSHDPRRIFFSENTKINESLVVLRRFNEGNHNAPTRFINLKTNPTKASESLATADAIRSGEITAVSWPRERMENYHLTPIRFLSGYLTDLTFRWFGEGMLKCTEFRDVCNIGPAERGTQDAYRRGNVSQPDSYGRVGMWFNNQEGPAKNGAPAKRSMFVEPDCSLLRNSNKKTGRNLGDIADSYWEQKGRLLLPKRLSVTSARLFSIVSAQPVIGCGWIPAKHRIFSDPEDWEKAMCSYLNSTVGVLAQMWVSNPKKIVYLHMSLDDGMRNIPVPDFTEDQTARLARVFEEMADRELMRFRDAEQDPVRKTLDEQVCEVLGWDLGEVESARRALCREPSVTGQPAG